MKFKFASLTSYQALGNNPILYVDPTGMEHYVNDLGEILDDREVNDADDPSVFMVEGVGDKETVTKLGEVGATIEVSKILTNLMTINAETAREKVDGNYWTFFNLVRTGAPWDYKNRDDTVFGFGFDSEAEELTDTRFSFNLNFNGQSFNKNDLTAADIGNFHAGFVGNQAGFSDIDLFIGAGMAESYKDAKKFELRFAQVYQLLVDGAPYGDEQRDYDFDVMGIAASRQWCQQNGINIREQTSWVKIIWDAGKIQATSIGILPPHVVFQMSYFYNTLLGD